MSRHHARPAPRPLPGLLAPALLAPALLALGACAPGGDSLADSLRGPETAAGPAAAAAGPEASGEPEATESGEGGAAAAPPAPAAAGLAPAPGRRPADFDRTTAEERAAALAAPAAATGRELGRVRVSLGNPTDPGIWIETPLVAAPTPGRAVWPETGAGIAVELRPATDASGTSRISLPALRLLGAPLTALPELVLYAS